MRSFAIHTVAIACLALLLLGQGTPARSQGVPTSEELFRIRVTNSPDGAIQVSGDEGATWVDVGKVVRPATTLITGFGASRWAPPATVAATAVHGVRLKIRKTLPSDPKTTSDTMMMSLVPKEFHTLPKGYGGHIPGKSGIYTDIPTGHAIFRNLAPYVGNPVRREVNGQLKLFPANYKPQVGDRLVIMVRPPRVMPSEILFENWKGGMVKAVFEGREPQPVARVARPVLGVGRYDATTYTGVGRINTNHCGVITISTAGVTGTLLPEGEGSERRGGIQIEPFTHAEAVSFNAPQVMVVEPLEGQGQLEGKPPLFSGYIGLFWDQQAPERSVATEVKIDNGPWEPIPEVMGRVDDAFTAGALTRHFREIGMPRRVTSGVTHLRLVLPRLDREAVAQFLAAYGPARPDANTVLAPAPVPATPNGPPTLPLPPLAGPTPPAQPAPTPPAATGPETRVSGVVTMSVALKNVPNPAAIKAMTVSVDGRVVAILNVAPFRYDMDTQRWPNGRHIVELRAMDAHGAILAQQKTTILVDNPQAGGKAGS